MDAFPYPIAVRQFECQGINYNVALTPALFPDDDGLDFSGEWLVLLISERSGTLTFTLEPDASLKWKPSSKMVGFDVIDELDKIITELRNPAQTHPTNFD